VSEVHESMSSAIESKEELKITSILIKILSKIYRLGIQVARSLSFTTCSRGTFSIALS
jgi:hypothetical protein